MQQAARRVGDRAQARIELFEYPAGPAVTALPGWMGWEAQPEPAESGPAHAAPLPQAPAVETVSEAALRAEFNQQLAEESRRAFEAGRERGRQEGRQAERDAGAAAAAGAEAERRRQMAALVEEFAAARERYLQSVEREVVELALAVAARILRREAQMDPLLLTGAVRVALGQLAGSTEVRLLVPTADHALWTEALGLIPNLQVKPAILAREGMRLGECEIETGMGTVDLGVRAQLGEIERGFFDRAQRPRPQENSSARGDEGRG